MIRPLSHLILLCLLCTGHVFAQAPAKGPLETTLNARLVVQAGGKESLRPADRVKPGDIVDYQVTYTNTSAGVLNNVAATLPIPAGSMVYLPASARPANVTASVDGSNFAPLPLQRMVKRADGTLVTEDTPISEYRALRWDLGALGAGKSATVSARMQVVKVESETPQTVSRNAAQGVAK